MSNIWREAPDHGWEAIPLGGGVEQAGIRFVPLGQGGVGLIASAGVPVRVNGQPVPGGFRVLEHRDEILVGAARYFFSAQSVPVLTVFRHAEGARLPTCPVCRGPIRDGDQAVCCPGCGRWFHQLDAAGERREKHCWTYAPTCRFCSQPTTLTEDALWRPEKEEAHV